MLDPDEIRRTCTEMHVMDNPEDFLFTVLLADYSRPSKILEIGAGTGAWGIALHKFASSNPSFDFIENFSYASRKFSPGYHWPSNKEELTSFISQSSLVHDNAMDFTIIDMDAEKMSSIDISRYDMIRWDCDFPNHRNIMREVFGSMKDDALFIVDDSALNRCGWRVLVMLEMVFEDKATPLWFGNKSTLWAKPGYPKEKLFDYMSCNKKCFADYRNKTGRMVDELGRKWHHCSTSPFNFDSLFPGS